MTTIVITITIDGGQKRLRENTGILSYIGLLISLISPQSALLCLIFAPSKFDLNLCHINCKNIFSGLHFLMLLLSWVKAKSIYLPLYGCFKLGDEQQLKIKRSFLLNLKFTLALFLRLPYFRYQFVSFLIFSG